MTISFSNDNPMRTRMVSSHKMFTLFPQKFDDSFKFTLFGACSSFPLPIYFGVGGTQNTYWRFALCAFGFFIHKFTVFLGVCFAVSWDGLNFFPLLLFSDTVIDSLTDGAYQTRMMLQLSEPKQLFKSRTGWPRSWVTGAGSPTDLRRTNHIIHQTGSTQRTGRGPEITCNVDGMPTPLLFADASNRVVASTAKHTIASGPENTLHNFA